MSLEDAILKLTAAVERNNELVEKVLASAGASGGDAAGEEVKKPAGRKPKTTEKPSEPPKEEPKGTAKSDDADEADDAVDFTAVRKKAADWLGEFAKESDKTNPENMHPEAAARKEKIKGIIKKLGGEKLNDLAEKPDEIKRLNAWLDKVKVEDKGFGPGRLAADPAPATSSDDDDDEV